MAVIRDNLHALRSIFIMTATAVGLLVLGPLAVHAQYSRQAPYSDEQLGNANALGTHVVGSALQNVFSAKNQQALLTPSPGVTLIPAGQEEQVVEVRVVGNRTTKMENILPHIRTRAGREFVQELVEKDVRRLNRTGQFVDIRVSYQHLPHGRVVIFEVVERPTIEYVKYLGNRKIKRKLLAEETNLKVGDALDPYMAEDARRALEFFYHDHGFGVARVKVEKGNKAGDRGVAFLINEGPKQRILDTKFIGNTIVSASRLKTQIKAKHGFLWVFGGEYDRKLIEEDSNHLTSYYHGLGYFQAKIGTPEITYSKSREWITVTYVINEGPRYKIQSVSVEGNKNIPSETLMADLNLGQGDFFNRAKLNRDRASIEEEYGSVGYIFSKIRAEPRFREEPGEVDLVYSITEGEQYRVGRIIPQISGENPHTQITTMLNRISLQPGDIVDIRKIRDSKRRLKACGLFEVNPQMGAVPDIVISDPSEAEYPEGRNAPQIARPNTQAPPSDNGFRGQSPDDNGPYSTTARRGTACGGVRWIDLKVLGRWATENDGGSK